MSGTLDTHLNIIQPPQHATSPSCVHARSALLYQATSIQRRSHELQGRAAQVVEALRKGQGGGHVPWDEQVGVYLCCPALAVLLYCLRWLRHYSRANEVGHAPLDKQVVVSAFLRLL